MPPTDFALPVTAPSAPMAGINSTWRIHLHINSISTAILTSPSLMSARTRRTAFAAIVASSVMLPSTITSLTTQSITGALSVRGTFRVNMLYLNITLPLLTEEKPSSAHSATTCSMLLPPLRCTLNLAATVSIATKSRTLSISSK